MKIDNDVLLKIEKSISNFKKAHKDKKLTKQIWIASAIQDKVKKDKPKNCEKKLPYKRKKNVSLILTEELHHELEENVTFQKAKDETYTKKKWILEAIKEKFKKENLV